MSLARYSEWCFQLLCISYEQILCAHFERHIPAKLCYEILLRWYGTPCNIYNDGKNTKNHITIKVLNFQYTCTYVTFAPKMYS